MGAGVAWQRRQIVPAPSVTSVTSVTNITSPGSSWRVGASIALGLLALVVVVFVAILSVETPDSSVDTGSIGQILTITFIQATLSTVFSLIVGILLAWSLRHRERFVGRRLLLSLLSTSMVLPTLVVALGLIDVFGRRGWWNAVFGADGLGLDLATISIYGLGGIVLAHTYMDAPFIARGLLHRLENIPAEHFKLARSLGLTPWQRFRNVEWPALVPALPGPCLVVFLLSFTSFAVVLMLGGSPRFNTLEVAIYEAIKLEFDLPGAVALALVQLVICGGLVLASMAFRPASALQVVRQPAPMWPEPRFAFVLQWLIIGLFTAFFAGPLVAVILDGMGADFARLLSTASFRNALVTSLVLASVSACLAITFALAMASSQRHFASPLRSRPGRFNHLWQSLLTFSGTVYLAVPALVLGLGFFLLAQFLVVRNVLDDLSVVAPVALVAANVMMALPFALVILTPALGKTADKYDRLAFSLNLRGWTRWRLIEWPVLRHDLGYILALTFCLSLGDLGVIALFGSQDFTTLPWLLFQNMGSYRTSDAAGIALILLALCLSIFFVIPRLFEGRTHAET
jgi:thiamine transport system permease protein